MKCSNPISTARGLFGCGQCITCRVNKRRKWTARLLLEAKSHADSSFLTLTYSDEHLPLDGKGQGVLSPVHLRNFIKALRYQYEPLTFRFFAVGEYGTDTMRPHYHLALFGLAGCWHGQTRHPSDDRSCCYSCDLIRKTWDKGAILQGSLTAQSITYLCGYVLKKMTNMDHRNLQGRPPEFVRASRNPGLGDDTLRQIAEKLEKRNLLDVPTSFRSEGKIWPLDRFSRNRIRRYLGRPEGSPDFVQEEVRQKLQVVRSYAEQTGQTTKEVLSPFLKAREQRAQYLQTLKPGKKKL